MSLYIFSVSLPVNSCAAKVASAVTVRVRLALSTLYPSILGACGREASFGLYLSKKRSSFAAILASLAGVCAMAVTAGITDNNMYTKKILIV